MYFHVYLIYRFTRTFTDHSSVITRCWGFELQNGKSSLKSPQTLATQDFAPASFLSTPDKKHRKLRFSVLFCCKNAENGVGQNVGQLPDPHRDPHRLAVSGFAAYCQLMPYGYAEMHGKGERAPKRNCFLSGALLACGTYRICAMKLPIFSAAFCCICRVTWV